MYRLAICDDESFYIDQIRNLVDEISTDFFDIYTYIDSAELLESHKKRPFDVILLDIKMPQMDGFEVSTKIKQDSINTILCFVTSEDKFAKKGYQYNIYRFISKSLLKDDLNEALQSIVNRLKQSRRTIVLTQRAGTIKILIDDIMYVESQLNYVQVYIRDGQTLSTRETLSRFISEINDVRFIQMSKSTYVNYKYIKKVDYKDNTVIIEGDRELYLTRRYKQDFKKSYLYLEIGE